MRRREDPSEERQLSPAILGQGARKLEAQPLERDPALKARVDGQVGQRIAITSNELSLTIVPATPEWQRWPPWLRPSLTLRRRAVSQIHDARR